MVTTFIWRTLQTTSHAHDVSNSMLHTALAHCHVIVAMRRSALCWIMYRVARWLPHYFALPIACFFFNTTYDYLNQAEIYMFEVPRVINDGTFCSISSKRRHDFQKLLNFLMDSSKNPWPRDRGSSSNGCRRVAPDSISVRRHESESNLIQEIIGFDKDCSQEYDCFPWLVTRLPFVFIADYA